MTKRVAVFIDGPNLYRNLHNCLGHARLGNYWQFFADLMHDKQSLISVHYFIGEINPKTGSSPEERERSRQLFFDQRKFLKFLKGCGVICHLGYFPTGSVQEKGVDVCLAVTMIEGALEDRFDHAFLVSGDGDLADAVRLTRKIGKRVTNLIFHPRDKEKRSFSYKLRSECDSWFFIDQQIKDFVSPTASS